MFVSRPSDLREARRSARLRGARRRGDGDHAGRGRCFFVPHSRVQAGGLRAEGRRAAAARAAHVEPHVVPGVDTETLDDVVPLSRFRRPLPAARLSRVQPLLVHLSEWRWCVTACPARRVLRAGDIVNVDVAVVTPEGWHADVSRTPSKGAAAADTPRGAGGRDARRAHGGSGGVSFGRGSATCWSRSRGGCARRVSNRRRYAATDWAGDPTSRRRFGTIRAVARAWVPAGHFFTIEPMATEGGSVATATLRDGDGGHRGLRVAERAVRHTVGVGGSRGEIFTATTTTTTMMMTTTLAVS